MGWFACLSLVVACGNSNKEEAPNSSNLIKVILI